MTALRSHLFEAFESLINEDYHTILIERKNMKALKIWRSFCKSKWLAIVSSCAVGSDLEEEKNIAPNRVGEN